ncbi:MAG: alpha/beta fold hydrolase [Methylococcaceae bacterium]|nr:alpha/beta fold hydrolase [Methylococcaceae bacterium]
MKLVFEEFGDSNNPPLIILHGFFASARNWRSVAEKLSAQFHVYVPDQRNHGASFHDPAMDYPTMAADLLTFIEQQALTKVSLLGHSMGGKVAMWFAFNHPDYINKLIVADIAPVSYTHCFNATVGALKSVPLAQISNRKQADDFLATAIPELSYRQFLLQNLVLVNGGYRWRVDLDIFQHAAPAIAAFPNTDELAPFKGNALFIAGEQSHYVKAGDLSQLFPTATLNIVAEAGHWLHVQQPTVFITRVADFLMQS